MKFTSQTLLTVLIFTSFFYSQNTIFKSLTVENGLSSSDVNCILQDKLGFIWIGTDNGLNRFDGKNFKVYRHQATKSNSISDNSIWALYEDRKANIWIGTKGGVLNKFSPYHEKFEQIKLSENLFNENSITSILEDNEGNIWIGTYSQGLFQYQSATGKINSWKYDPTNRKGLSNNYITSLFQDSKSSIWISTYNGLNRLNPKNISNGFEVFTSNQIDVKTISNNLVWRISQSKHNKDLIWIGTAGGLCFYDLQKGIFTRLNIKADLPSLFSNSFASVEEQIVDGKNILWAATYGGLFKIDLSDNNSEQFVYDKKNANGLLGNQIDQLIIDRSGVLWIATDKGLNYHSLKTQKFNKIFSQIRNDESLQELLNADIKDIVNGEKDEFILAASEALFKLNVKDKKIEIKRFNELNNLNLWSLAKGSNNDLWIGTYGNGLINFDLKKFKKRFIKIESPTFKTSAFNYIKSLHLNKNGFLWIGFWGGGLASLNTKTDEYKIWIKDDNVKKSLSFNDIWAFHEDKLGRLWIGTNGGGLNLFVPKNDGEFISWKFKNDNKNSLINNSILTVTEISSAKESETTLLIGTENGLSEVIISNNKLDIYDVKLKFNNYPNLGGLIDKSLSGIMKDDNGILWISSNNGLMRFDQRDSSIVSFGYADGLNSNIFNSDASCKSESGIIVFGSVKGPVIINPSELKLSDYNPNIILTDFQIFNKSIEPGDNSPLNSNISFADKINLDYDQNVITIKFASMDFNASEQIQYSYILEGFNKAWVNNASTNSATYTNLDPGSYIFKVKSTNSDGFWSNNLASIKIIIAPPIWKTPWAYIFYLILIIAGIFAIRKFEMSRNQLRNELKLRDLETKKIREIENMKSRFFANLSHEFRTPLMLIKGPAELLLSDKNSDRSQQYQIIHRNSEKLQNLIDQLLELSQLESSSIPVKAKKENIIPALRGLFYSFASYAEQKNINIKFSSSSDNISAWFDRDKLDKILNNILSNAFKFTTQGGSISVDVKSILVNGSEYLQIFIKDSGIGIPKDKIEKIFDRFYQVDDSSNRAYGGSGIGLSLVRELVDLHKWKIFVESEVEKGTEFILEIPLNDFYLDENEKFKNSRAADLSENTSKETLGSNQIVNGKENFDKENNIQLSDHPDNRLSILVVEDSEDVRIYLSELLKYDYKILLAENGKKGLQIANENLPDLIISDIMMPEMDGIEFCRNIKTDWRTSYIPVILLTAKATSENKIEGLETGADDYVTKPFSFRELSIRIKNLIAQRTLLKEKYSKDVKFIPENITSNKADQKFIQNAVSIIEKHLGDSDFDSDKFASEIFLSRSQLHRKLHSISGQSTGEFIRTIRLKKAAGLILEKKLSVTQIALEIGFNSPSHFTKAFKQMFDCLPSEFIDRSNS